MSSAALTQSLGAQKLKNLLPSNVTDLCCLPSIHTPGMRKGLTGEMNSPLSSFSIFMPSYILPPLLSQQGQVNDMLISSPAYLQPASAWNHQPFSRERDGQFQMEKGECVKQEGSTVTSPFIFPEGQKLEKGKGNFARFTGEKMV